MSSSSIFPQPAVCGGRWEESTNRDMVKLWFTLVFSAQAHAISKRCSDCCHGRDPVQTPGTQVTGTRAAAQHPAACRKHWSSRFSTGSSPVPAANGNRKSSMLTVLTARRQHGSSCCPPQRPPLTAGSWGDRSDSMPTSALLHCLAAASAAEAWSSSPLSAAEFFSSCIVMELTRAC